MTDKEYYIAHLAAPNSAGTHPEFQICFYGNGSTYSEREAKSTLAMLQKDFPHVIYFLVEAT